ncbi:septum formation initiator family protein [Candidatus Saccharibacteria bacterium]|nr:septum formation initiator family protein [Candidatus Saccharibacteria bacterium]
MLQQIKNYWSSSRRRQLTDVRNIGLYVFAVIVLAITWSGIKTVKTNYELQKKISTLKQQNAVLKLQNENSALQNQYYQTNQYLELAARQDFGLAAPGEQVLLIPKDVAMKYVDPNLSSVSSAKTKADNLPQYRKNLQAWRDFLLGHKLFED